MFSKYASYCPRMSGVADIMIVVYCSMIAARSSPKNSIVSSSVTVDYYYVDVLAATCKIIKVPCKNF